MDRPYPVVNGADLAAASRWVEARVDVDPYAPVPAAVKEATTLLAAVYADDPLAKTNEALVPNMVRLMIFPWAV